jgi:lipoprotein-releasing system permease protein
MRIIFTIARRYLFSRTTTHLINIITGLSIAGLATGACVLILVMSVFNGLETTILSFFNAFNPDVKIEIKEGKTFSISPETYTALEELSEVNMVSKTLEEVVLFEHDDRREVGKIKGVPENYNQLNQFDSTVIEGTYSLDGTSDQTAVAGVRIGSQLGVNVLDPLSRLRVYALTSKSSRRPFGSPFEKLSLNPTGLFSIQKEYDQTYVFAPLKAVQDLLQLEGEMSAIEVKLSSDAKESQAIEKIQSIMGPAFEVSNRYEQEEEFLRLMRLEKWLAFIMLSFASLLVAFNMVGTLWLIVLDKRRDLSLLQCIGLPAKGVARIILTLGGYIATVGFIAGTGIALILSVNAYPVELRIGDIALTAFIILIIGLLAALPAAYRAQKIPPYLLEE